MAYISYNILARIFTAPYDAECQFWAAGGQSFNDVLMDHLALKVIGNAINMVLVKFQKSFGMVMIIFTI